MECKGSEFLKTKKILCLLFFLQRDLTLRCKVVCKSAFAPHTCEGTKKQTKIEDAIFEKTIFIRTFVIMLHTFISQKIREELSFVPNEEQEQLLALLGHFVAQNDPESCFVLHGYAGTGKTSLVSALVKARKKLQQKTVLMAPTGRAAKVFSMYADAPAYTVHKTIYRQKSMTEFRFLLDKNLYTETLFIVDEASMIANYGGDSNFGSGNLLDDLIDYVRSGKNCTLLFLGDSAQLPPIEQQYSPALDANYLEGFGLHVTYFSLTVVARQALESGILSYATQLREELSAFLEVQTTPFFKSTHYPDVICLSGSELIEKIDQSYREVGVEETIIITRSNKRANLYNNGIRNTVFVKEDEISNGDLLMVTKNNYFWQKDHKEIDFIANGEVLEIDRINRYYELYGFRFADMTLHSLDYDWEIDAKILLDGLHTENPAQMNQLGKKLFEAVSEDYAHIGNRRKRFKQIFENEYFNALQVKFAYAITCHKAQGGQWKNVFIDHSYIPPEQMNADYYRWLYTAITRAREKLYLVNFPQKWFQN